MSPLSGATVTYTPTAANTPDSFTFRVRDSAGATGDGIVTINPTSVDPPANPTTVIATDSSAQTTQDVAATLVLRGTAPAGVALTFSIVSGSGPSNGTLGAITQGSEVPPCNDFLATAVQITSRSCTARSDVFCLHLYYDG